MSTEAKKAFEEFQFENAGLLDPLESRTLYFMADKCLPKSPFLYYAGDNYGAMIYGVSTTSFREGRRRLEKRGAITCVKESAYRSCNKRYVLTCLLPEGLKGISPYTPLESSKVEVEQWKGISEGISLTPERYKSVSSMKSENLKIESRAEQFFNDLISQLPKHFSSLNYGRNVETLFRKLDENFEPAQVAHFLKQNEKVKSSPASFLFVNVLNALQDFLNDPTQAVEDFKRYLEHKETVDKDLVPNEPFIAPERLEQLAREGREQLEKLVKQINDKN